MRRALFALSVLIPAVAHADETLVRAEVDARKVGVDDHVQLTVSIEGRSVDLTEEVGLPSMKNLSLVGGPSISTQISFVNGAVSQVRSYTYVLRPVAPGPAEVGSLHVKLKSGEKTTSPIALEVVSGSLRPKRPQAVDPFGDDPFGSVFGRRGRTAPEPKLFVEAHVSRTRLRVGEPLLVTYFLYTQTSVTDLAFGEAPQYPGFWSEDLEKTPTNSGGDVVTVEGENYRRLSFLRKLLFPTKAGSLTIPASTVKLGVPSAQSFFDVGTAVVQRATKPVVITVEPLPNEPGFTGAVGTFRASASLDRPRVPLGEAATLRFQVEGRGNLKWIEGAPEVAISGAKVYPPQVKSDVKVSPAGIEGSRTWEFIVVPETAGSLTVPPLPFSYFDPSLGRLVNLETSGLSLHVEGASTQAAGTGLPATAIAPRQKATLVLRSDLELPGKGVPSPGPRGVVLGLCLVFLAHGLLWGTDLLRRRESRATGRSASRRGLRDALSDLGRASRGDIGKEAAANLIEKALHDVFGPLDGDSAAGAGKAAAQSILEEVHFLRYAPQLGDYSDKIREVASRAADAVRRWA